ncbi:MAG: TonB family protein [Candidatus Competibacteraceae bacterium]|nr:TonB family protein [Candidatus Competibacteraceae bacterium]
MLHWSLAGLLGDFLPAPQPPSDQQLMIVLSPGHSAPQAAEKNSHLTESPPSQKPVATAPPPKSVVPIHVPPAPDSASTVTPAATPAVRPVKKQVAARSKRQAPPVSKAKSPTPAKQQLPARSKPPKKSPTQTTQTAKSRQSLAMPSDSAQSETPTQSTTVQATQAKLVNRQAALGKQLTHSSKGGSTSHTAVKAAPLPDNPKPRYPMVARKRGFEGRVVLQVTVMTNGSPINVQIKTGSGHSQLDRAALEAVRRWRFRPAQRGGQPVSAVLDVPVVFRLNG